jgi:hypothetical protein
MTAAAVVIPLSIFALSRKKSSDPNPDIATILRALEKSEGTESFDVTTEQLSELRNEDSAGVFFRTNFGDYLLTDVTSK